MYKLKVNATVTPLLRDKHYLTMRELVYYVTFFEGGGGGDGREEEAVVQLQAILPENLSLAAVH